jgi:hypothetical protein
VRTVLGVLCFGLLLPGQDSSLWQLTQSRRLFELRQAARQDPDLFYSGIVAARFGHEDTGIEQLRRFLQTHPDSERERRAHEELAAALVRTGHFGDAVSEYREVLRMTQAGDPDRSEIEDELSTCQALQDVPPQSVEFGNNAPVKTQFAGFFSIPLSVNGRPAQWAIDTGASLSVVTESEARKLGLVIQDGSTYASGSTGKKSPVRTAVAQELELGGARFRNVAFAVDPGRRIPARSPTWVRRPACYTRLGARQYLCQRRTSIPAERADSAGRTQSLLRTAHARGGTKPRWPITADGG